MSKARIAILLCLLVGPTFSLFGQTCSNSAKTNTLICAFPQLFGPGGLTLNNTRHEAHFQGPSITTFRALNKGIGEELSTLPLGSAGSGISFQYTPGHGLQSTEDSLGPILTERAQVIKKGHFDLGVAYQYFNFGEIDGLGVHHLKANLYHITIPGDPAFENDYITTDNTLNLHLNQVVIYGVFGLASRLDVSAEIPIEQVHLSLTSKDHIVRTVSCEDDATCTGSGAQWGEYHYFGNPTSNAEALADVDDTYQNGGNASGIGDVILRAKGEVIKGEKTAASVGVAFRVPSGDANNFLGSGTFGVTPFGAFTYRARVSPHVRFGYQWNGDSILAGNPDPTAEDTNVASKASLPPAVLYSAGVDMRVSDRVTIAADLIGARVLGASRVMKTTYTDVLGASVPDLGSYTGDYSSNSIGTGFKVRLVRDLVLTGNVTTRVDNGGLVARVVPLVGLSYAF